MAREGAPALRETPLSPLQRELGARFTSFAGYQLPLHFEGRAALQEEHLAVRRAAGLFDISHMGRFEIRGEGATSLLAELLTNRVCALAPSHALYTLALNEQGGIIEDLIVYRLGAHRYLAVVNAANRSKLGRHLAVRAGAGVRVVDRSEELAMVALQGPQSGPILAQLKLPRPGRMALIEATFGGAPLLLCGTGYTGERCGFELIAPAAALPPLFEALRAHGARPCGLGARDSLRIEAALPLYGNELDEQRNPLEAGLERFCREGGYVGAQALARLREEGIKEQLCAFVVEGRGLARPGNQIVGGGVVTSATYSPLLGRGIGLAYLPAAAAQPGAAVQIEVRGKVLAARLVRRPLDLVAG